jgi:hypothetical protein
VSYQVDYEQEDFEELREMYVEKLRKLEKWRNTDRSFDCPEA